MTNYKARKSELLCIYRDCLVEFFVHGHCAEINDTAGVTPFVIVPAEDLAHVTHNHGGETIEDGGVGVTDDIR